MLRKLMLAALLVAPIFGCGATKRAFGIRATDPSGSSDRLPTSVYGDWVLASEPDSTAFAGARLVEMRLAPADFGITVNYPAQAPVVIRGTVVSTEGGALTLSPTSGINAANTRGRTSAMFSGKSFTVLASAAGGTLVFAPANKDDAFVSSVWHQRAAAEAAGQLLTAGRDTIKRRP
ncbi:MAG: hypothetical protein NVS1B4_04020 [Gemmatimonadaceae bacterium]